jgi:hypothetical protein
LFAHCITLSIPWERTGGEDEHDLRANIATLNHKTQNHKTLYCLKSFKTRKGQPSKRKGVRTGADDDGSPGAGGRGTSATDSEYLKAHGYEVKSDVIVDRKGGTSEPLVKVWQPFVRIIHCADARPLDAAAYPHCISTVRLEQAAHREESFRGFVRA